MKQGLNYDAMLSRPTRGAWIEMSIPCRALEKLDVAPHAGRVD